MSDPNNPNQPLNFGYKKNNDQPVSSSPYVQPIPPSEQRPITPSIPAHQQPFYQQPQVYAPAAAVRPANSKKTLAIILSIVGVVVIVPAIAVIVFIASALGSVNDSYTADPSVSDPTGNGSTSAPVHDYEMSSDYYWDMERNPFTGLDNASEGVDNTVPPSDAKYEYQTAGTWLEEPVSEEPVEGFYDGYPDVNDFFNYSVDGNNPDNIHVVISSDPEVNCGLKNIKITKKTVASCYNPAYGNVLFMWWAEESPQDLRLLSLFHAYSHYVQTYDNFDAMYAAYKSPDADQKEIRRIIEQDATCRVYYAWDNLDFNFYDRTLANPCGNVEQDEWDEYWLVLELEEAGVKVF